jgi:hypothetical protein
VIPAARRRSLPRVVRRGARTWEEQGVGRRNGNGVEHQRGSGARVRPCVRE